MLALDDRKLLPPGVHDVSLKEVEELFGRFQRTDRRPRLFRKLHDDLKSHGQAEVVGSVIIDGSLVMGCVDEPEDIDLILSSRIPADAYNIIIFRSIPYVIPRSHQTIQLRTRNVIPLRAKARAGLPLQWRFRRSDLLYPGFNAKLCAVALSSQARH